MEDDRISYHDSVRTVYKRTKEDGMTNVSDRNEAQGMDGNPRYSVTEPVPML